MKIGISALLVHPTRFGGAETYARQLLAWLPQVDRENEYFVFAASGSDLQIDAPNFQVIECPAPVANIYARVLWEHLRLPRFLREYPLDLVHFPGSTASYGYRGTSVVTIHETLRFLVPELTPFLLGRYYNMVQKNIVRTGKHVIAVSHADAQVMVEHLGLGADQYSVVPHGVNDAFLHTSSDGPTADGKSYLLWVGYPYRHKNLETLFDAVALLAERDLEVPPLRLVGVKPNDRYRLLEMVQRREIAHRVSLEPPVGHTGLPELYRGALVFCFPSKYESFGLPVLEALASQTAVVCSDLPCFRELFTDHVLYCPVTSPDAFADAIARLLTDTQLRHDMQNRGRALASEATWEKCAQRTVEVYEKVFHAQAASA
jgi:glycosyltransferase involved in cell wall biosynthesis